jgi:hypothetical protein
MGLERRLKVGHYAPPLSSRRQPSLSRSGDEGTTHPWMMVLAIILAMRPASRSTGAIGEMVDVCR